MRFQATLFCGSLILQIIFTPFREIVFAIDQEVCFFSFQTAVYFAILKIRTHYSGTYKFPKGRTCKK